MGDFDLVVVAGSHGALRVHKQLWPAMAPDLPAAVIVVQHRLPDDGMLAALLGHYAPMPVREHVDGAPPEPGAIVVAPADRQLVVGPDRTLVAWPVEPGQRPGCLADPVLRSAASAHGPRVIAVVLSGRLDDGAAGAAAVKQAGGRVLVQSPATATAPSMPTAALATGCADLCLEPERLAGAVSTFAGVPGSAALLGGRPAPWAWPVSARGRSGNAA